MDTLKLAGIILIVLGIVEAFVWRVVAPQNPNLAKIQPILMLSAAASVVIGVVLLVV